MRFDRVNFLLFFFCSLVWGSTWLVIKYQIESVSPTIAVFYRFVLASIIFGIINLILKSPIKQPVRFHYFFVLQGFFNFSLNYILTYYSERLIPSGMVALTFTSLVFLNMMGMSLLFKKKITGNVKLGGIIGAIGIGLIFYDDLVSFNLESATTAGLLIGLLATTAASSGNMVSYHLHLKKIPVVVFTFWGMVYGALATGLIALLTKDSFFIIFTNQFILSTLYLSVLGTVLAFWSYFVLVGRLGAEKASYTSIISPAIAILASSLFENLSLTPRLLVGVGLCLLGNAITLAPRHQTE